MHNSLFIKNMYVTLFWRTNFIITASGIVTLYKRLCSMPVESRATVLYFTVQRVKIPDAVIIQVKYYGTPTRCNNNRFIDLQDQLNVFRANLCSSSGAQD
jgi:hypothetical protein